MFQARINFQYGNLTSRYTSSQTALEEIAMTVEGLEELFQQTWLDHVLHYGLLVGAIFQLICIAAIVVLPPRPEEESSDELDSPEADAEEREEHTPTHTSTKGSGGQPAQGGSKKKSKGARKRK